jgi:capsid protein
MNRIRDLDDMHEAELINKQVEACLGVFISGGEYSDSPQNRARANRTIANEPVEDLAPGLVQYLNEGEMPHTVDPARPGGTFQPFIEVSLRSIAASANIPYELLAKNFFRTTYSSGRLAMLDGKLGFRMRNQTEQDMHYKHMWRLLVWEMNMKGMNPEIPLRVYRENRAACSRHKWKSQTRGLLDPEKENKAHDVGKKGGFESTRGIVEMRGENWEDFERQQDIEARRQVQREVDLAVYRRELEQQNGLEPGESIQQTNANTETNNEDTAQAA